MQGSLEVQLTNVAYPVFMQVLLDLDVQLLRSFFRAFFADPSETMWRKFLAWDMTRSRPPIAGDMTRSRPPIAGDMTRSRTPIAGDMSRSRPPIAGDMGTSLWLLRGE